MPNEEILDKILAGEEKPVIRQFEKSAALITEDSTLTIKKAENTNKFYVLGHPENTSSSKCHIRTMTSIQIECSFTATKVYQVLDTLPEYGG